ncbi:glycosyltransferase family 2 protein [Tamlana flava]|uniref:glycosyltransferase family 2 protein n=1 Tax=Tamlana flava TaxID=3158572 RepID=UPI00351B1447
MLSILIPTYNCNIVSLVKELYKQAKVCNIDFEIICLDDASTNVEISEANKKINTLQNCLFQILKSNIGRSKIRNLLANQANFQWLLFLDADVMPVNNSFIETYINSINYQSEVIYGGILYENTPPAENQMLRWKYGKKREALSKEKRNLKPYLRFLTLSFLIHKNVFKKVSFNEDIPNLRHEDTLFALELQRKKVNVSHINNPVYHLGLETSQQFLLKSLQSMEALSLFIDQGLISYNDTLISKIYFYIRKIYLHHLLKYFFVNKLLRVYFENQLLSKNPSLFLFDLYRLGYFCSLKTHK